MSELLEVKEAGNTTFDKLYRITVILLLISIFGVQVWAQVNTPQPTDECLEAIRHAKAANSLLDKTLDKIDGAYDSEVYDRADNINQQIFLSNEFIFRVLTYMALADQTAYKVEIVCR
jgi:hypothetical protein